jgi:hypothetical protein
VEQAADNLHTSSAAIRVALAELPPELHESLEQEVTRRADMRLVPLEAGSSMTRMDLLLAVAQGTDVLVLGTPDAAAPPGICDHLVSEFPALMILLVSYSGDLAILYWQGPRRYRVRRVSADALERVTRRAQAARVSLRTVAAPRR